MPMSLEEAHRADQGAEPVVIDGGDRSCGELLLVLHREMRDLPPGTVVELIAHDPIAPIDLPVWCHLTGHRYLGLHDAAADTYLIVVSAKARPVRPDRPWHLAPTIGHDDPPADLEQQTHRETQEST